MKMIKKKIQKMVILNNLNKFKNKPAKDLTLGKVSKAEEIHNSLHLEATTEKREKTNKHNHLVS